MADVTRLIPFYAIGVFTSFTLSQAGMAKRHLRIKEPHWQVGLLINGLGAIATGTLLVVIGITKFTHGAWAVIVLVPIMVVGLIRLARQYEVEQHELQRDLERFNTQDLKRPATVLLVDQVDSKTIHALQYAKTIRADDVRAVHIEDDPLRTLQLETAWSAAGLSDVPLKILRGGGEAGSRLAGFIGAMPDDRDVNVLVPVSHETSARERLSESRTGARLTKALLPYERVRVTLVRDHPEGIHPLTYDEHGKPVVRLAPRGRHTAIVLVDKLDSAVLRAVRYPLTLGATEVWAVHAAVDPDRAGALVRKWMDARMPVPLDVIECWDRNVDAGARGVRPEPVRPGYGSDRRDGAPGLPQAPSASPARPDEHQDHADARSVPARGHRARPLLFRASPGRGAGRASGRRRPVGSPA